MKQLRLLREVLNYLTIVERRRYFFVMGFQALLGFLDLAGVAVIGAIGAITIRGINSQPSNGSIQRFLEFIGLGSTTLQKQVIVLSLLATGLLITKTFLSILLSRKIFMFLARVTTRISGNLTKEIFNQDLAKLQALSIQRIQFSVSTGVSSLVIGILGLLTILVSDLVLLLIIFLGLLLIDAISAMFIISIFIGIGLLLQ